VAVMVVVGSNAMIMAMTVRGRSTRVVRRHFDWTRFMTGCARRENGRLKASKRNDRVHVAMKGYTCTAARYIRVALKESSGRKVGEEEAMNSERSSCSTCMHSIYIL
jgi:hypothetical protein